jgi:hypothetical protein
MSEPILLSTLETHGLQMTTLLKELEANFPLVNPTPQTEHAVIMYRAGQRSVVEYITNLIEDG